MVCRGGGAWFFTETEAPDSCFSVAFFFVFFYCLNSGPSGVCSVQWRTKSWGGGGSLELAAVGTSFQQLRNEREPQSQWANHLIDFSMEE